MSVLRLLGVLVLFALAGGAARADSGTLLLPPGEDGEVAIPTRAAGDRVAYRFNVSPPGEVVEFEIHYLKDGAPIVDRAKANMSGVVGTFFPLRRTTFFLDFHNWVDRTLTVEWEWHYVRPVPPTRDVGFPAFAALGAVGAAAWLRRR